MVVVIKGEVVVEVVMVRSMMAMQFVVVRILVPIQRMRVVIEIKLAFLTIDTAICIDG